MLHDGDPRALESLLGLSAESVHPENGSNAATVDRLVDSLPQSLVEARGGVSGGLPPPPPPPPQQVAISSASPQPAQTPILLTASHVLDGQQGLTFTVAPHGVHQHHLMSSGGAVASSGGHTAPAGTQFVAFPSPLSFAPAGFVAIGGGGPAGGGTGGSPATPVAPSSPSPVQSPYHLQTHSPLAQHASSLPRSSPAPPPLTPSPSPSPSSSAAISSVAQAVGPASVSVPVSAPTTLHHLRPNTPIQVQLPASAFPLLQILQQSGASGGTVTGTPFRANAGAAPPQQHIHPQPPPPPPPPRPKQPQLLPKPASGAPPPSVSNPSIVVSTNSTCIASPTVQSVVSTMASSAPGAVGPHGAQLVIGQNQHHHHHSPAGTLVLNQMIPGLSQSPVIIQQPGGGVQFILRQQQQQQQIVSGPTAASAAGGVLANPGVVGGAKGVSGGLVLAGAQGQVLIHHPQHQQLQQQTQGRALGGTAGAGMAVQTGAATTAGGQVVRFITTTQGPMQLQQIQTPSGPTLIAVPPGQTLSFQQIRGATTGAGSVVPGTMLQGHAQIIQGATVAAPTAQTLQGHILHPQPQQPQPLVHSGLANQVRASGPTGAMLPNHSAVNVMDSVGMVQRTRAMAPNINPISVISPPPSLPFPPPQTRKKPKKKKKRKGSRDDEEDGEGSTGGEVDESGEEICGSGGGTVPMKTLNLADIMKSAGIGDDEDLGPFESSGVDAGDDGSLVQAPPTVATSQSSTQQNSGGSGSVPQDICTSSGLQHQTLITSEAINSHPGLSTGTNHQQTPSVHPSAQQSPLLTHLQGPVAVQQGQGQVRFALSEDGRVVLQRDCSAAMQVRRFKPLSPPTQPSIVSSGAPIQSSQSHTILLHHQQSVATPRAHLTPPVPQPVSQLLSTSANTPSGNIMGGGVGSGSGSGGSPSTGSPAPNNHVVLSQLLSHNGCGTNITGDTALPTLPVGTQLGGGTPANPNLRNHPNCGHQPSPQLSLQENQLHSPIQLPSSPQFQKAIPQSLQQPVQQIHQPPPPSPAAVSQHQQPSPLPQHSQQPSPLPHHQQPSPISQHQQASPAPMHQQPSPAPPPHHQQPSPAHHQQPSPAPCHHQQPSPVPHHQQPSPASIHHQQPSPAPLPHLQQPSPAPIHHQQPSPVPIHHQQPSPASIHHQQPSPAPIHHQQPSPAPVHHQQPSPASIHHQQPSPAPIHHQQPSPAPILHQQPSPAPPLIQQVSPAPPRHQQPSPAPLHQQQPSPVPMHHHQQQTSPAPMHHQQPSPLPMHHHHQQQTSSAPIHHLPPVQEQPPIPQASQQQSQPASPPPPPLSPDNNNHQSNNTVTIGGLVLTQQQQALLHQIKMSDLVAAGAASGLGAKSLTEALIQALSAVASNISLGGSPTSSSSDANAQQKGNAKFNKGGKSPPGPPTSTQLLLQQLGAAVAAAARKVIPAGAVMEPGLSQDIRRPSPPVARKRRKKAEITPPTMLNSPRHQGCGSLHNDVARAAARLCHPPNLPRTTTPLGAQSTSVNSFPGPIPSAMTESRLSSPIVPAPPLITDTQTSHSNTCDPVSSTSQESRLSQITVPVCQQSPPHLVPISSSATLSPSTTSLPTTTTSSTQVDSKVLPVTSSSSSSPSGMVVGGQSGIIQRVQTIQLTAQKQQQLREVQQQLQTLTSRKGPRSAQDNIAIQHLYLQQQRILLTGKIVPTIPGQHAQGVQFSPMPPSSSSSDQSSASLVSGSVGNSCGGKRLKAGSSHNICLANLPKQPVSSSSPQSPTIRYYHQVGNQIIPLAPQQAATSTANQQHASGVSKSISCEARPIKSNVGPTGSIASPEPPSPSATVHSPSVSSAPPIVNDCTPMTTCQSGPNSPVSTNSVVGGSINVQGPQRELYVCIGGNNVSAEDEGDSSSVESALSKQIQGGTTIVSEEQSMGSSPCSAAQSKTPLSSSSSISQISASPPQVTSGKVSTSMVTCGVQVSSPQINRACGEAGQPLSEDTTVQPMDSSNDSESPRGAVKRPALSPVRPTINKVSLIEQQLRTDQAGALNPDVHTPFADRADACKRLVRYHVLNERVLSARDLDKADEIFEATARHLLDKFSQMTAKYRYLLLMESMKEVRTSELMMIDRMFVAEEQLALERLKEEARLAEELEKKKEEKSKSDDDDEGDTKENLSSNSAALNPNSNGSGEPGLKEVRISLHDVLKSESIKKEAEEGRYTIVRNSAMPTVKEEEESDNGEDEKPYDEWEAIQKELSVYCGVKREEGSGDAEHPPNGEPGARRMPVGPRGGESSCEASRSPGLVGPAPPLDDPGGGGVGENSNLCEDDDINAQVQSAIDSILNLQRAEDEGLGLEDVFDVTLEEEEDGGERRTTAERSNSDHHDRASREMACEVEEEVAIENVEEGVVSTLSKEVGGGDLALDEAVRSILSS
ncbi:trithorax group protein osa-like isoform X3 [Ischnura elegans]|uniref:trithorax group protein osa-like isoform X3 n=1 Tax=Ischnura elegans TaxID=197161 RepID=UPI001ED8A86F|nr:trithorax group protein osa-like isoform X3 [Ischnura elegans]